MICTGTILAMFEIPIVVISMVIGIFLADYLGVGNIIGFLFAVCFMFIGIGIFRRWWFGKPPFDQKANEN